MCRGGRAIRGEGRAGGRKWGRMHSVNKRRTVEEAGGRAGGKPASSKGKKQNQIPVC